MHDGGGDGSGVCGVRELVVEEVGGAGGVGDLRSRKERECVSERVEME